MKITFEVEIDEPSAVTLAEESVRQHVSPGGILRYVIKDRIETYLSILPGDSGDRDVRIKSLEG